MNKQFALVVVAIILLNKSLLASGPGDLPENLLVDREQQQLGWCFTYSNILGYNISYISNPRLFNSISSWLGTPYKYNGNNKEGIDCSGFVSELYNECYNKKLIGSSREIFSEVEQIRRSDLREGDLVFFKIKKNRISHVGIYLGQNKFVHASTKKGVMVSDLEDPYYLKSFFKGGRVVL